MYGIYDAVDEISNCEPRRLYTLHPALMTHKLTLSLQKSIMFPQGDYVLTIEDNRNNKELSVSIPFIWKQSYTPGIAEAIRSIRHRLQRVL